MAQEPANAFRTTTSCLPAYIQLCKWHLIAQGVAMVTFLSHTLKCTHTHVELEESQATSFHDTPTQSQGTFPGSQSQAAPKEPGMRSGQLAPCLSRRRWVNSRSPTSPEGLTWEQFCSGRLLQCYGPGLSKNWHSCSAPWRCGAGSSLLSCEEEQKQDTVSSQVTPSSPGSTFSSQSLPSPEKFARNPNTSSPPVHLCQHSSCYNWACPTCQVPQADINVWQQFNSSWSLSPQALPAATLQHSLRPDAAAF